MTVREHRLELAIGVVAVALAVALSSAAAQKPYAAIPAPLPATAPTAIGPPLETGFTFREPALRRYTVADPRPAGASLVRQRSIDAHVTGAPQLKVQIRDRVVLHTAPGTDLQPLLQNSPLILSRRVDDGLVILQAHDAWAAAEQAQRLARLPGVLACYPVMRRPLKLHRRYGPAPDDPLFTEQWHLENRRPDGSRAGPDLNLRAAWPVTRGAGIVIAVCDDGVELSHPDLAASALETAHFNFFDRTTNGFPLSSAMSHGTAVAGIAAASGSNRVGVTGVAPEADFASLVIFDATESIVDEEQLMDLFQDRADLIPIQNHSWGNAGVEQLEPTLLEQRAISNAATLGRGGRGVIFVRAGGNNRLIRGNTNDDGYPSNPFSIGVAGVRSDGRAANYSSPGASLLIAAPSGDEDSRSIATTDRQGILGYNTATGGPDRGDYALGDSGFSGTSAATPQISGLAALLLAVNPSLGYRDVQQILIHAARQFDLADPDLHTNGAGFIVSHNTGFGVPDAGEAVHLAPRWLLRPPMTQVTVRITTSREIPDDSLRLLVTGQDQVPAEVSLATRPTVGPHVDTETPSLPLVYVGMATNPITADLRGRAALIRRGTNFFRDKIAFAASAGAAFAVIHNHLEDPEVFAMDGTDYVPIPAVFISKREGESLVDQLAGGADIHARIRLMAAECELLVTNQLVCEHVCLELNTDHTSRGDVRVTLLSPAGTRSVLQRLNSDQLPGPAGWRYYSTHHFYEPSAGLWRVFVSDENPGNTGSILDVSLTIRGVAIDDSDADGLSDSWERRYFGSLAPRPADDSDADGYSNAREAVLGTNPASSNSPLELEFNRWNAQLVRLSWPGTVGRQYEILSGLGPISPAAIIDRLPGRFPEMEWFVATTNAAARFLRVRALPSLQPTR